MPYNKCLTVFSLCAILITEIKAAELDTAVPIELARAMVETPSTGEVRFYDEVPASFPDFTVPDEFVLVGAMEFAEAGIIRIVLTSPHVLKVGTGILNDSLETEGYSLIPKMPSARRGFIGNNSTPAIYNLCNDDLGALTIRSLRRGIDNLYSISGSRTTIDASGKTCGDRVRTRMGFIDSMIQRESSGIRAQLPAMLVPTEENSESAGIISGTRGSGGDEYYEISSQLVSGRTASYIHDHIAEQLLSQGWNRVQVVSERESNWRTTIEDQLLFGELIILEVGEEIVNLYFRISKSNGLTIEDSRLLPGPRPFR